MLYHISNSKELFRHSIDDLLNLILIPRIPHHAGCSEDISIPRVCMSDSVLGCLNGIGVLRVADWFTYNHNPKFLLFEIDDSLLNQLNLVGPTSYTTIT